MRKITITAGTFVAGAAALLLSTGVAQASAERVSTPVLLGSLQLAKTGADGTTTTASLNCVRGIDVYGQTYLDGNGTVTDPTAACQELAAVNGDFTQLNVHPSWLPTAQVAPVTASATGHWGNTAVNWSQDFTNPSALAKKTGDVFVF
ncbi:Protease inhibitor protein [Kitasatospora sp. MMS16-BH015]|uniref:SSI family serine proteinase inhibitor n=1 Tax=Kitasatospora sp. MMS16-BH015 TaxID=2018025 RepID=UPI000CA31E7C|nr:SSI family serine proteinase inhibitor [Kitasatospora sp. MMS16-BH015]AUG75460.1 Protease inhibitor protein [Kitasatospora sp. MMS16-BH015]